MPNMFGKLKPLRSGELSTELMNLRFFAPLQYTQYFMSEFLSPEAIIEDQKSFKKTRTRMLATMKSRNLIPMKKLQIFEKELEEAKKKLTKKDIKTLGGTKGGNSGDRPRTVQEAVKRFTQVLSLFAQQVVENGIKIDFFKNLLFQIQN